MVYIKKEKPNGNITADIKAYHKAYYKANKVRIAENNAAAEKVAAEKVEAEKVAAEKVEKANVNITADIKAYRKAYYKANKEKVAAEKVAAEKAEMDRINMSPQDHVQTLELCIKLFGDPDDIKALELYKTGIMMADIMFAVSEQNKSRNI
jgi:hypothetical protein